MQRRKLQIKRKKKEVYEKPNMSKIRSDETMGGVHTDLVLVDDTGKRIDGRKKDELRPIKIEAGVLKRADGSCYIEWGGNKILSAVYGPREAHPRHVQNPVKAIIQARYGMAPFSVDDRKKPGPDRRSVEISKVLSDALEAVVFTEQFPRCTIDIFIEVLQANAGTRCAALTASSVALADAGIPMRDLVVGCAGGKVQGHIVVDINKEEDNYGEADLPLGYIPSTGEIVLLQMDGHLTPQEFQELLDMEIKACHYIYTLQKEALKKKYNPMLVGEESLSGSSSVAKKEDI